MSVFTLCCGNVSRQADREGRGSQENPHWVSYSQKNQELNSRVVKTEGNLGEKELKSEKDVIFSR